MHRDNDRKGAGFGDIHRALGRVEQSRAERRQYSPRRGVLLHPGHFCPKVN